MLAELYGRAGRAREGLQIIAEALAGAERRGEHLYEPDLYRVQGNLFLLAAPSDEVAAEARFRQAIAVARDQAAKSYELRATVSLALLWQRQGERRRAHDLLAEIYGWFTEGFGTADLRQAKALLAEL
jgi:predicted ATPase